VRVHKEKARRPAGCEACFRTGATQRRVLSCRSSPKRACPSPHRVMNSKPSHPQSIRQITKKQQHTCSLSLVSWTEAVTRAHSPPGATGFGAKAHGVRSLLLPSALRPLESEAPRVIRLTLAVTSPPSLLLLKLGSWVMKLRGGRQRAAVCRTGGTPGGSTQEAVRQHVRCCSALHTEVDNANAHHLWPPPLVSEAPKSCHLPPPTCTHTHTHTTAQPPRSQLLTCR
jgi:hypothetical protein